MRLAETEWMALHATAPARGTCCARTARSNSTRATREFRASLPGWQARERHGIVFRHVEGDEMAALQPGLSPRFVKGTFVPGWKTVADPKLLGKAIWAYAESKGARFDHGDGQRRVAPADGRIAASCSRRHDASWPTGWSSPRAPGRTGWPRQLGDSDPARDRARLQHHAARAAFDVKRQLIFSGHGFVVTPLSTGIRVGGAVELGGLDRPPNYARSKAMLDKAQALPARARHRGRPRMDGLSPVAAGLAAGDRPVAQVSRTCSTPSATAISA